MSINTTRKQTTAAMYIDSVLQNSYLLVVELRQGRAVENSKLLRELCATQIEDVRQQLKSSGLSQRNIDHISHAQCALLDETVLRCAEGEVHADWASEPLQARFFSRHQAGDSLYEDMREVLHEPAPDPHVLTVFQRLLTLGFQGRYRDAGDPEREQLLATLNAQVAPLELGRSVLTQANPGCRIFPLHLMQSPLGHALAAGVLVLGTWWVLNHLLGGLVASLLPGQV